MTLCVLKLIIRESVTETYQTVIRVRKGFHCQRGDQLSLTHYQARRLVVANGILGYLLQVKTNCIGLSTTGVVIT